MQTAERDRNFEYSVTIVTLNNVYFVKKDSAMKLATPADFKDKTICKPLGYGIETIVQKALDEKLAKLDRPKDLIACYEKLKKGEVDIVPTTDLVGLATLKKHFGTSAFFDMVDSKTPNPLHLIFSKKNPNAKKALEAFNQAFRAMDTAGEIKVILNKHLN